MLGAFESETPEPHHPLVFILLNERGPRVDRAPHLEGSPVECLGQFLHPNRLPASQQAV